MFISGRLYKTMNKYLVICVSFRYYSVGMVRKYLLEYLQNKNAVMFTTALVFITGIMSYFNNCAILSSGILTITFLALLLFNVLPVRYIIFWIIVFYLGFFNAELRTVNFDELSKSAPAKADISGQIVSIPNSNQLGKTKFFFRVSNMNGRSINGKALVTVTSEENDFSKFNIGKSYKISGAKLRLPAEATNPSQFDYAKYLRNFNTHTVIYADIENCSAIDSQMPLRWKFLYGLNNVRNNIIQTHAKILKSPNLEILGGIVFGDDAIAPPDYVKDSFANSGLLHILAASGMNVAFIYSFWYFFMRRLRVPFKFSVISGMGVVVLYTLMTGLGASVVRAALMLLFVLAGKLIDRDAHSISLLSFVAVLMLIYNPAYINDVGFQLSFIVTFGLLTTAVILQKRVGKISFPYAPVILSAVLIPVVAQVWVVPVQMFYFNTISTYSVFANIAIMPFLSVLSFGGFVSSILAMVPLFAKYICPAFDFVLNIMLNIIVWISNFCSHMPHAVIQTTHPAIFQLILYYAVVLLITFMFKIGFSRKLFAVICGIIFIICISTINIPNKNFELIAFDVNNADAFLLKTPQNKYFMIDTGKSGYRGGKSQAEFLILKYFKDYGIKNLEGIIITHFDNDHSGGAYDLIKNLNVKNVYINSLTDDSYTSSKIYSILKSKNVNTVVVEGPERIYAEHGFAIDVTRAHFDGKRFDNENSIFTLVTHKDFKMLFTCDAGVNAFQKVKSSLPSDIDILKVGHHGGSHVVDFDMINRLKPEVSIISTGTNTFGHPAKSVLDTLRNTSIYRTDLHHSIKIISKGHSYEVRTFDKNKHKYIKQEELFLPELQQSHQ